jgi:hypothetical protein
LAVKLLKSAASIRETDLFAFNLIFLWPKNFVIRENPTSWVIFSYPRPKGLYQIRSDNPQILSSRRDVPFGLELCSTAGTSLQDYAGCWNATDNLCQVAWVVLDIFELVCVYSDIFTGQVRITD